MTSQTVRKYGRFDLGLTLITIVFITVRIIVPLYPNEDETSTSTATEPLPDFPMEEVKKPEPPKTMYYFDFWLIVGMVGIIGLMGLAWSLVLIKRAGFRRTPFEERIKWLDYWLLTNVIIAAFMVGFGFWSLYNGSNDTENDEMRFYLTKIPYGIILMIRLILMCKVFRTTNQMAKAGKCSNEEIENYFERRNTERRNRPRRPRYEETEL